jgi:protease-4
MPLFRFGPLRSWPRRFWHALDVTRRFTFNLLFLLVVVILVVAWIKSGPPALAPKSALVLDLKGSLAEQRTGGLRQSALDQVRGETPQKIQLRDIRAVLEAAGDDARIERVLLILDDLDGAGPASLHEVAGAIDRFRAKGKPVVAWGSSYDQRQYYLASRADEIYLHPMGMVVATGYGRYRAYYHDALDKLGVAVHVMRVGTFKSFAEPYTESKQSPAAREADAYLYGALWSDWLQDVEKARKLEPGSVTRMIDELPQRLAAVQGDVAQLALKEKLVDGLKTRDELRALLIERGARDDEGKTFRQISFDEYLARLSSKRSGDAVGVVVAEGEIVDGNAPAGSVGGLSTSELIRKAREDEHVKAVVLRVNSPGGSAFGSELVRRELELTRDAGKPVVVSMGDVAASGGFWISLASDEVIADRSTITGSIGVIGLFPTGEKLMEKIGVNTDGVTTTWLAGSNDPRRPIDPRFQAAMQSGIENVYRQFIGRAAQARKTEPAKIDAVGQGRVWTGAQAKERGLVDRIGSYGDALDAAAARGKLEKGYRVAYIEKEPSTFARVAQMVTGSVSAAFAPRVEVDLGVGGAIPATAVPGLPAIADTTLRDLATIAGLADGRKPFAAAVHCLCTAP